MRRLVPSVEQREFVADEDVEQGDRPVRLGGDLLQQGREPGQQPFGRTRVGEVLGVLQHQRGGVPVVDHREVQVELRHAGVHLEPLGGQAEHVLGIGLPVVADHHLEQRGAPRHPGRVQLLDDALERQVTVGERGQIGLAHPVQQRGERRLTGQIGPQHQRVHEEPDEIIERRVGAPGDRGAQRDVVPGASPVQQRGNGRLEHHERARSRLRRQVAHGGRQLSGQRGLHLSASAGRPERTRTVQRQRQLVGRTTQDVGPEGDLIGAILVEEVLLPQREVGVLHRKVRPHGTPPAEAGLIRRGQVAQERAVGPFVGRAVVQDDRDHLVTVAEPQDPQPHRDLPRQVERCPRQFSDPGVQPGLVALLDGERDLRRVENALVRLAVVLGEHRPQDLVPAEDVAQGGTQGFEVQMPAQPEGQREVVGDRVRIHPVNEPEAALGGRKRDPFRTFDADHRRPRGFAAARASSQFGDRGRLEQVTDGQFGAELGPGPADEPGGEQRMAAEIEEVVLDADTVQPEDLGEERAQRLLRGGLGRTAFREPHRLIGFRQCPRVELAVVGQRQGAQRDERGRDHVVRQFRLEPVPQALHQFTATARGRRARGVLGQIRTDRNRQVHPGDQRVRLSLVDEDRLERAVGRPGAVHPEPEPVPEFVHVLRLDPGRGAEQVQHVDQWRPGVQRAGRLDLGDLPGVRDPAHAQRFRAGELLLQRGEGADLVPRQARRLRDGQGSGRLLHQNRVVAVPAQLVVQPGPFDPDLRGDVRKPPRERGEVVRVDQEFLLERGPTFDRPPHLGDVGGRVGAGQLDRGVEGAGEPQVPDVADEQRAAGREQADRLRDDVGQVVDAREVLDDRVDHDRVEPSGGQAVEHVRWLGAQVHFGRQLRILLQLAVQLRDHRRGEVGAPVLPGQRRDLPHQQTGADADLQYSFRLQLGDPVDGRLSPFPHVLQRDRVAVVAGVPAREVLGEQRSRDLGVLIGVDLPPLADLVGLRLGARVPAQFGRDDVPDEPLQPGSRRVGPRDDGGLRDLRVPAERGLDLAEFDAVAADLDLVVGAAEEVEVPVRAAAHQVTGAVHAPTPGDERVGDEPFRGQAGTAEVTAGQPFTGDVELSGDAVADRAEPGVHDVGAGVPDRLADGRGVAVGRAAAEGVDRVLGGAVQVVAVGAVGVPQPVPHRLRHRLAAEQDERGPVPLQQPFLDQQMRVRRRHVDDVDLVLVAVRHERPRVAPQFLVADVDLVPLDEPQQLLPGHVEGERHGVRDPQPPSARRRDGRGEDRALMVELHVRQAAVRRDDTLGFARRARRVDDVGRVFQAVRAASREQRAFGVGDRAAAERPVFVIVDEHPRRGVGQCRRYVLCGHQAQRPGVLQHHREPLGRVVEFQGQIRGTGPQHGEQRDDHVDRPRQAERDHLLRRGTLRQQQPGHPVDPGVELGIGQLLFAEHHGRRVGRPVRLGGEQVRDRVLDDRVLGLGPTRLQRGTVLSGHRRERGDRFRRIVDDLRDQ
ncbi:hypothetical protein C791_0292 [Amycolatopsis azurea DSM 43854]|uniref:Uncharacterized protein n=1 Tax=Amycolatopsis azurea DSM 43854 TaxID=1238180 RepID=M2PD11_9PSEU|nr:hypothetical protein C791_0292 [Amycolatopsis azurea DSM 43854]